jgi:predicted MFS family arabinose efflux permease
LTTFLAIYALFGFTSSSLNPIGFLKSISAHIEDRRGLAIGLTLSGTAVGAALVPQFAQYMIARHGWRTAYLALACLPALVALPSTLLFVREPQSGSRKSRERSDPAPVSGGELTGLTFREALVTRSLWLVAGALFLVSAVINGTTAHAVPFLVDHHYTAQGAASVLAGVGLASVIGRIGSGFMFDRFFAPYVAVFFFGLLIVGLFLLAGLQSAAIAMICVGLTLGFELDMVGYLVPRYFGLRKFGQIYALLFGSLNAGGAVGPLIMGVVYTTRGNYLPAFVAFGIMLAIASVLMLCLPRYAFGTAGEIAAEAG